MDTVRTNAIENKSVMAQSAQEIPAVVGHRSSQGQQGLHSFPLLLTHLLCPQRAKPAGTRCPRVKGEPSMLLLLFMNKGKSEGQKSRSCGSA